MMKICMMTHDRFDKPNPRADLIRFKSIGEALAKQLIDVVYITSNEKRRYEVDTYKGSKVYKIPLFSTSNLIQLIFFNIFVLPVMFREKKTGPFNIVLINSIFTIPVAFIIKHLNNYCFIQFDLMGILAIEKFINTPKHFMFDAAKKILSSIEDFLLRQVDFITTINEQHRKLILKRIDKPIYVIRDGVFESVLKNVKYATKDSTHESKIVLIFVGQINHYRLDSLFKILPTLIAELPNLHLLILGEGHQVMRYKEMALSLGLEEHVTFLGYVSHEKIFDYIEKAHIAYSDDWSINGFPMKIFEYMALGKAIIAERTDSVKEVLTDWVNGLTYKNESELSEKILLLVKDPKLRFELGKAAQRIMDKHTWEVRAKQLKLIYQQITSQVET